MPIVSIVLCIVHIQLEASIRSGDIESFNLFNEIGKRLGFIDLQKDRPPTSVSKSHEEERRQGSMNLPLEQHQLRDKIRKWKVPRKPSEDVEHADQDGSRDDRKKTLTTIEDILHKSIEESEREIGLVEFHIFAA